MNAEFVDTNVLLYALSQDEPVKRERAQSLLERLWQSGAGRLRALQTPSAQRDELVDKSAAELAASMPLEERNALHEVVRSLDEKLAKVTGASRVSVWPST